MNLEQDAAGRGRLEGSKAMIAFGLIMAVILVVHLTPLGDRVSDVQTWQVWLGGSGALPRVLFVACTALLVAIGTPRLLLSFVAGMMFGVAEGLIWGLLGSILGAYALFLVARWARSDWTRRRITAESRLRGLVDGAPTIGTVFLVRQLPAPGFVANIVLGSTAVRHRVFLIGSVVGFLPASVVATLCGSGLVGGSLAETLPKIVAAAGIFLVAGWAVRRLVARASSPRRPAERNVLLEGRYGLSAGRS